MRTILAAIIFATIAITVLDGAAVTPQTTSAPLCVTRTHLEEVCGTDGNTYPNPDVLNCEAKKLNNQEVAFHITFFISIACRVRRGNEAWWMKVHPKRWQDSLPSPPAPPPVMAACFHTQPPRPRWRIVITSFIDKAEESAPLDRLKGWARVTNGTTQTCLLLRGSLPLGKTRRPLVGTQQLPVFGSKLGTQLGRTRIADSFGDRHPFLMGPRYPMKPYSFPKTDAFTKPSYS